MRDKYGKSEDLSVKNKGMILFFRNLNDLSNVVLQNINNY